MTAVSLTALIKENGVSFNAATILAALKKTPLVEEVEYISTSGSGEVKHFYRLVGAGLEYGENRDTIHEFKTEMRFYRPRFPALLKRVVSQLSLEIERIKP